MTDIIVKANEKVDTEHPHENIIYTNFTFNLYIHYFHNINVYTKMRRQTVQHTLARLSPQYGLHK